jgi:hypothetical protein
MMARTRYFVILSLVGLAVGVGAGLVAYYIGIPTVVFSQDDGPAELAYVPRDASLVAYANVQEVMRSEVRQHLLKAMPREADGRREFQQRTGIDVESDIDHVVAGLAPSPDGGRRSEGVVLARGRFDEARIEALMREHGASVESYRGARLIVADAGRPGAPAGPRPPDSGAPSPPARGERLALTFIEPGLAAVGSATLVRQAIDLKNGGSSVTANENMMTLIRSLEAGNAWAVGRFDQESAQASLPPAVARQLPPLAWFTASGRLNGGMWASVRAETLDQASADGLRDILRGMVALARLQAGSRPEVQELLRSLELGGSGTTVAISFELPVEALDLLTPPGRSGPP